MNRQDFDRDRSMSRHEAPGRFGEERDFERPSRPFDQDRDYRGRSTDWERNRDYGADWDRNREQQTNWERGGRFGQRVGWDQDRDYDRRGGGHAERGYGGQGYADRERDADRGSERGMGGSDWGENTYGGQRPYGMDRGDYQRQGTMGQPVWRYTEVWLIRGPYSGRGPRNYQRSDERIRDDVCERLTQHGQVDASEIDVKVRQGEVTLTGTVDSRHTKRLAEDTVEDIPGVREVHNELRVDQGAMGRGGTSNASMMDRGDMSAADAGARPTAGRSLAPEDQPSWSASSASTTAGGAMGTAGTMDGENWLSRAREGMDVIDRADNKIGSVARIHRTAAVGAGVAQQGSSRGGESSGYLELDTGFLGLGKSLYIPMSAITDVRDDRVIVNVDKDGVDQMGWDQRPAALAE